MFRLLACILLLSLTARALAADKIERVVIPEGKPEFGHGLTDAKGSEGWLSLFDGKTTFGWEDAKLIEDALIGGRTTSSFEHFELSAAVVTPGTISVGGKPIKVEKGNVKLTVGEGRKPIVLGDGVSIRVLTIQPHNLKSIMPNDKWDNWKFIQRPNTPEEKKPKWKLENGILSVTGGPGALEYSPTFANQLIQVEARSRSRHANGGVFIRSIPGDFMNGYEAQIHSACVKGDSAKPAEYATGGIDDRQNARRLISRDFEPFVMTILADGPHLATWVNGYQVTDWTDTRKEDANPRKGLRLQAGTIQLQAHDPATDLEFHKILIRELK